MVAITIREARADSDGWQAVLSFAGQESYPFRLTDPFDPADEALLRWYFEQHIEFPLLDHDKASAAVASIGRYGEALFGQIFADPKAHAHYRSLAQVDFHGALLEVVGTPGFHRLHWEALKDPALPDPLALQLPLVRRGTTPPAGPRELDVTQTLNLLVVTARPGGTRDVGYRTISRPLVEQLRNAAVPVRVDIVRPGTYDALIRHLKGSTTVHGPGYYHVIHLDLHGELREADGRAVLLFEGHEEGEPDPVVDTRFAELLIAHGIPVAILNACQSGMQASDSEASLASRLLQAGVQHVVAMSYSVTVSAAERMLPVLYRELFAGRDLGSTLRLARLELYRVKARRSGFFDQAVDLEDWVLPVAYESSEVRFRYREPTKTGTAGDDRHGVRTYPEPSTEHGFIGRDLDVLAIERRVLEHNVLLVQGMVGVGKSTLLRHLGAWWQTTHFVEEVFEYSDQQGIWSAEQIVGDIAHRLLNPTETPRFEALSLAERQAMVAGRLRARRHLLILDNLDAVTDAASASPEPPGPAKWRAVGALLASLSGGRTIVLVGGRGDLPWLATASLGASVHTLEGLDSAATSTLAERVLQRHGVARYRTDSSFRRLLDLLDGFPSVLIEILPKLAHQPPGAVLQALDQGLGIVDSGQQGDGAASILGTIRRCYAMLPSQTQELLACLAPFTSSAAVPLLDRYDELLREQPSLGRLPAGRWQEVLAEAAKQGLVARDPANAQYVRLHPLLPYFLRGRLLGEGRSAERAAIGTAFRRMYDWVADDITQGLLSTEAERRLFYQATIELEQANLRHALGLALAAHATVRPYISAFLAHVQTTRAFGELLELSKEVLSRLDRYPAEVLAGPIGRERDALIADLDSLQLELGQAAATKIAKGIPEDAQDERPPSKEPLDSRATAAFRRGKDAQARGRLQEAEDDYRQALQIFEELGDHDAQIRVRNQFGIVALDQGRLEDAEGRFRGALALMSAVDDPGMEAVLRYQLATALLRQGHSQEAQQHLVNALANAMTLDDDYLLGAILHLLSVIAMEEGRWNDADKLLRKSLTRDIRLGDRRGEASTYLHLGQVAKAQGRWQEADRQYRIALNLWIDLGDRHGQASAQAALGVLAMAQDDLADAKVHLLDALAGFAEVQDLGEPTWTTLAALARIWRRGDQAVPELVAQTLKAPLIGAMELLRRADTSE